MMHICEKCGKRVGDKIWHGETNLCYDCFFRFMRYLQAEAQHRYGIYDAPSDAIIGIGQRTGDGEDIHACITCGKLVGKKGEKYMAIQVQIDPCERVYMCDACYNGFLNLFCVKIFKKSNVEIGKLIYEGMLEGLEECKKSRGKKSEKELR